MTTISDAFAAIQETIWKCTVCMGDARIEVRLRQQTRVLPARARLLIVATAPPYQEGVHQQIEAPSVHSDPKDRLRAFITRTLELDWGDLVDRGLAVVHAVKCAIVPRDRRVDARQHQNPPSGVTTKCARLPFSREFRELKAPVVMTLGGAARLAVRRACGVDAPPSLTLPLKDIPRSELFEIDSKAVRFRLIASCHPSADPQRARDDLLRSANIAGIRGNPGSW